MLRLQADYVTGTGEIRTVQLTDDSTVSVAPSSAIEVAFADGERHVRLTSGEAYFEVAPEANRPFRVTVDNIQVTVLGTGFNVSQSGHGVEISVAHGAVRVEHREETRPLAEELGAGEFARVDHARQVQFGERPTSQVGAWRQNQLIAQDQSLGDVVDRLRRYHSGMILVIGDSLAEEPVTGVYDLDNPAGALRAIARSQNALVREITPWLLILSRP